MVKQNSGRKNVEMVRMKNEKNLRVTFSKRKSSLFRKASELCTLCGVDIALIVFSPGGKVFSFGHQNINLVLERFSRLNENSPPEYTNNTEAFESNTDSDLQNLNERLTKVLAAKEEEKAKKQKNKMNRNEMLKNNHEHWYQNPQEEFNLTQAVQMKHVVEEFMKTIDDLSSKLNPTITNNQNFHVGSSSNVVIGTTIFQQGGNNYTNQDSLFGYDPNMFTPNQTLSFGNNHDHICCKCKLQPKPSPKPVSVLTRPSSLWESLLLA